MTKSAIGRLTVIACVFLSYAFFALPSTPISGFTKFPYTPYHLLTEGFLDGHLSFTEQPLPELLKLKDPYDPQQNAKYRLHDASLYHGQYYLYFGPLPVLTVLLPIKFLMGFYAPETVAIFIFTAIGFLFNFLVLIKIKDTYFSEMSERQLYFAGVLTGLANNSAYLFSHPRFYEDAIASAYCFMSIAIYFLLRIFTEKESWQNTCLFSAFLSFSVAGRPHFVLACCVIIPLLAIYFQRNKTNKEFSKSIAALLIPALSIGAVLALYNYLRFDSIFEFGHKYQVSSESYLINAKLSSPDFIYHMPGQFYFYFIKPYIVDSISPVAHWAIPLLARGFGYDFTVGVLTTAPIVWMICLIPFTYKKISVKNYQELKSFHEFFWGLLLITGTLLGFLLSLNIVAQRYETDFVPYLLQCAFISIWLTKKYTLQPPILTKMVTCYFLCTGIINLVTAFSFAFTIYRWHWNAVLFSEMTVLLYYLIPITMGLVLLLAICMRLLPVKTTETFNTAYRNSSIVEASQ